jgi:hypothetical protein
MPWSLHRRGGVRRTRLPHLAQPGVALTRARVSPSDQSPEAPRVADARQVVEHDVRRRRVRHRDGDRVELGARVPVASSPSTANSSTSRQSSALRGFGWLSSEWEVDGDAAAAEGDEGNQRRGGVKAEASVADQADAAVEALEAALGTPDAHRGEDSGAVAAYARGHFPSSLRVGLKCNPGRDPASGRYWGQCRS